MKNRTLAFRLIIVVTFLLLIFASSVCVSAYAEDKNFISVITAQMDEEEIEILNNKEYYSENLQGDKLKEGELEGLPYLTVYRSVYWEYYYSKPIEEIIAIAEKNRSTDKIFFGEQILRVTKFSNDGQISVGLKEVFKDPLPKYIEDLINWNYTFSVQNVDYIYCFEDTYGEAVVYFAGENTNVAYYESKNSQKMEYTSSEFAEKSNAYHSYITSNEFNYDKDGNGLIVGRYSFESFLSERPDLNNGSEALQNNYVIWICVFIAVIAIGAVVAVLFIIRKRKNK